MTKCKKRSMMLPEIERVRGEQLCGTPEAQRLARPGIQLPGYRIQLFLREATQVAALGQILPQQAVGVLVEASLPRTMRIGEVDRHPGGVRQPVMGRHFPALLVRQRQTFLPLNPIEHRAEAAPRRFGTGIVHPGQHREQGGALYQRPDGRAVLRPLDESAFPVPRYQPFFHLRRSVMNADHVRHPSSPIVASRSGTPFGVIEAQPADHVRPQGATGHGVDSGVDCFVRHLQRGRTRMHNRQGTRNLFGRVAGFQVAGDLVPQRGAGSQAAHHTRGDRTGVGARLGHRGTVATSDWRSSGGAARRRASPAVATEFARQRRGRTIQPDGNRRRREAHLQLRVKHRPFVKTQLRIDSSPTTYSPKYVARGV